MRASLAVFYASGANVPYPTEGNVKIETIGRRKRRENHDMQHCSRPSSIAPAKSYQPFRIPFDVANK